MWRRGTLWATAMLAAAGATGASPAGAGPEAPRQTYSDRFTTDVPGAASSRVYAIDYFNPDDPEGKPHAFSHLRVELADGARFDTSALPYCKASDAQLIAAGAGACPAESRVGTDETLVDTGFAGSRRYFTADFVFFNNRDELVLLATARESGTRVVVRGRIGENTLDIDNPMLPGTPPDGAAAKRQRGQFDPAASAGGAYLTTPPTCPDSGVWVNRITYTYRDGVKQTAHSESPCRRPTAPPSPRSAADRRRPVIRIGGIPRRCVKRAFRATFRIADTSALRSVRVTLGRRKLATSPRTRFSVRVPARRLRAGRHAIRVAAVDAHGNRAARTVRFRRCRS